jgi:hypothetical protein
MNALGSPNDNADESPSRDGRRLLDVCPGSGTGAWGVRKSPSKAASSVTAAQVGEEAAKPANEVITGFLPEVTSPEQSVTRRSEASKPYRELIELELSRGRNAMRSRCCEAGLRRLRMFQNQI